MEVDLNKLVRVDKYEDGDVEKNPKWHWSIMEDGAERIFCNGQVIGYGEGDCEFTRKFTKRGGITCQECLSKIEEVKEVRL